MICREAELPTGISDEEADDRRRPTEVKRDQPRTYGRPSSVVGQFFIRSMFSPGSTVIVLKLDMRTSPGAAPLGFERNLRSE